ncbi:hypothetical protein V2J09_020261 [Rumex salicifolius]
MASPNRESIDTFVSITGSSEEVAVQRLEEHNGDLQRAINAHFSEGTRNLVQAASVSSTDMEIDQPAEIVDVTDSVQAQGPEIHGNIINDDDDADSLSGRVIRPSEPTLSVPGDRNDIEEQMIRAAIEASKQDAELQMNHDLNNASQERESNLEDDEILPLVRNRSRHASSSFVSPHQDSVGAEVDHPLSSPDRASTDQPQITGNAFQSDDQDEWGGISSVERDEAVMLEAAMFGGVPQERLPFAPRFDTSWRAPRPPSPGLTAQRLIREQQDDEYLASLQADREKALKALEEERAAEQAALAEERRKQEIARLKLEEEQELERLLAAKEASLPKEPANDDDNTVTLLVRMPDGSRRGRRFLRSDKLQSLYDFIDVGRAVKPGTYRVVRPFPRRPFGEGESSSTLKDLGLTSKQEALYLEPI